MELSGRCAGHLPLWRERLKDRLGERQSVAPRAPSPPAVNFCTDQAARLGSGTDETSVPQARAPAYCKTRICRARLLPRKSSFWFCFWSSARTQKPNMKTSRVGGFHGGTSCGQTGTRGTPAQSTPPLKAQRGAVQWLGASCRGCRGRLVSQATAKGPSCHLQPFQGWEGHPLPKQPTFKLSVLGGSERVEGVTRASHRRGHGASELGVTGQAQALPRVQDRDREGQCGARAPD